MGNIKVNEESIYSKWVSTYLVVSFPPIYRLELVEKGLILTFRVAFSQFQR